MPTHCRPDSLDFGTVEGRAVVAGFDGGVISSDAGGLLLGATDKAIGLKRICAVANHEKSKRYCTGKATPLGRWPEPCPLSTVLPGFCAIAAGNPSGQLCASTAKPPKKRRPCRRAPVWAKTSLS